MNDKLNTSGNSNTGLTLMGFALGAAVGAGLALLMAPDSGKNTRKNLASTARRWSKGAGHVIDQARDVVADLGTDAKSALQAGQDAFQNDRAVHESRSARVAPGHNAVKREEIAR